LASTHCSITIDRLEPAEVLGRHLAAVADAWEGADRQRLQEILPRHARREGFRFLGALTGSGRLVGFAYGYHGAPGQWWHDVVAGAMDEQTRKQWLAAGHFELTELHVHRDHRRRGLGGRLHDELLAPIRAPAAVLTVRPDNAAALHLYRGRGWRLIIPSLRFPGGSVMDVMGLELPAAE
jgi:ribosomal protein S18 acetylase RimI-like enzyme